MKIKIYLLLIAVATAALVFLARAQTLDDHALNIQKTYYLAQIAAVTPPNLTYLGDNALASLQVTYLAMISTNGVGSATNAVSQILTNGVQLLSQATALDLIAGANMTITGTNGGATAHLVLASTGGGSGAPLNGTNVWTGTNTFTNAISIKGGVLDRTIASGFAFSDNVTAELFIGNLSGDATTADALSSSASLAFGAVGGPMVTTNANNLALSYNASGLTNFNAANLTGTVPDAQLGSAALTNRAQTFTAPQTFGAVTATTLIITLPITNGNLTISNWNNAAGMRLGTNGNVDITGTVSGSGAGLTGTAASLSIGGNAATATSATYVTLSTALTNAVTNIVAGSTIGISGGQNLTNINVWDTRTNVWTINTALPLGTNTTTVSSTATIGFTGLANLQTSGQRWAQWDILASGGDVTVTNPPGCHPSDNQLSRVCTNGNTMTVAVQLGIWTNMWVTQGVNK